MKFLRSMLQFYATLFGIDEAIDRARARTKRSGSTRPR